MVHWIWERRRNWRPLTLTLLAVLAPGSRGVAGETRAKIAIATSLTTAPDHLRQQAFDGKLDTNFESAGPVTQDDYFTLIFDKPVSVKAIGVKTGHADGTSTLADAKLESSGDGTKFAELAIVGTDGIAHADVAERMVRSIRLRAGKSFDHPVVIREFVIDSAAVKPFAHLVEFTVDSKDAPELQTWSDETARLCEQWYDFLTDYLATENDEPTNHVALIMRRGYRGVAEAGGGRITGSVRYFERRKDDQGAMIHETIHVIQHYRSRRNPGWLVEGVADYIRSFVSEPGKAGPVDPAQARYDGSYRTTATFLDYLTRTYDPQIVKRLNKAMREGTYDKGLFEQITGKPVESLNDDWIASLRQ